MHRAALGVREGVGVGEPPERVPQDQGGHLPGQRLVVELGVAHVGGPQVEKQRQRAEHEREADQAVLHQQPHAVLELDRVVAPHLDREAGRQSRAQAPVEVVIDDAHHVEHLP